VRVRVRDRANPNPTPHLLDEEAQRRHLALGGGEVDGRALVLVAQVRALPAREHLLAQALHVAPRTKVAEP